MKPISFLCLRFWLRAGRTWWSGPMLAVVRVLALVVVAVSSGWAQPGSGGPGPAVDPTVIPLDGGVSLLLAGGVGYAIRRLRRQRTA